jgi:hypothetical protein
VVNVSLEIEAASRDELALVGIKSIKQAMAETEQEIDNMGPDWQHRCSDCTGCPEL